MATERLKGEGDRKLVEKIRVRRECENCGQPAFYRNTYLMPGARRNPASRAYGRDDCTWCSDHEEFLCGTCHEKNVKVAVPADYTWCSTFFADRLPHLFLTWHERELESETADPDYSQFEGR